MWKLLVNRYTIAAAGSVAGYYLLKKNKDTGQRLREAKMELIEQQRTIDRLRAELGRERHQQQERIGRAY